MSCTQAQLVLLIEYIERQVENKAKKQGLSKETIQEILKHVNGYTGT